MPRNSDVTTEVIVVNDRSTDRYIEIIKKFPVKLINKLSSTARNPYGKTLNLGIKHAKGDYIAVNDADIEVESDWLVRLLPHFRDEDLGTVSGFTMVPPSGSCARATTTEIKGFIDLFDKRRVLE